jgi:hypothetical protein
MRTKRVNFTFDRRHQRRIASGCIVMALALSLLACSKGPSQSQDQTNSGSGNPQLSAAERQRRIETIRAYFRERAPQKLVVATTRTKSGQIIDWIRPESQLPPGQKLAPPPQLARVNTPLGYTTNLRLRKGACGRRASGTNRNSGSTADPRTEGNRPGSEI